MNYVWSNWSGWVRAWPRSIAEPATEEELASILREAEAPVRPAGTGHSFTPLVESPGTIVTLRHIAGVVDHDPDTEIARIKAGTTIRDLGPLLFDRGLGLVNQGDIDRQSLAGAVGTGTHGTGGELGSLSACVVGFRLVTADGEVIQASRKENPDVFNAGRVSMGSLGIMSEITMQCRPAYVLEETGGAMPIEDVLSRVEELRDANRHFEFFWFPYSDLAIVKILGQTAKQAKPRRRREEGELSRDEKIFVAACEATRYAPFIRGPLQKFLTSNTERYSSGTLTEPGRVRWSHEAFPSDRHVRFNEMEYAVPADLGPDCLREVAAHMRKCGENFLFPLEYRYVAADDIWLSPFYGRDSATISVHQYYRQPYEKLFAGVEAIFARYEGRPHWGKLHTLGPAELSALYPHWDEFQAMRMKLDPKGKFLNGYLRRIFGEE